jgi:hypothetical protein
VLCGSAAKTAAEQATGPVFARKAAAAKAAPKSELLHEHIPDDVSEPMQVAGAEERGSVVGRWFRTPCELPGCGGGWLEESGV